jgi:hypothetical protein
VEKLRYRLEHIGLLIAAASCLFCRGLSLSLWQNIRRCRLALGSLWRRIALAISIAPSAKNIRLQKNDALFANRTSISLRPCSI